MTTLQLLGRLHTFAILHGLREQLSVGDGWANFTAMHQASGCSARTAMDTVRACVAMGWVTAAGKRKGWRLSIEGEAVLRIAEQLVARDGEPGAPEATEQFRYGEPAPVTDRLARARAALEAGPVKVVHRGVPRVEDDGTDSGFGKKLVVELDEEDPFGRSEVLP